MSGTNDRKAMGGAARRLERHQKEQHERRKLRTTTIIVVLVLAILFAGALFLNSKYIRRTMTALTVSGVEFSAAEYDYFFNNAYYEYYTMIYQSIPDYASSMLPSTGSPFSSQIYDAETGKTWADFFSEMAIEKMSETALFYNASIASGFTLPDDKRAAFEEEMAAMKENAGLYGYSSFNSYIQQMYGRNMNEKTLLKVADFVNTAAAYSEHIRDSFTYTDEQLISHYAENTDKFDNFTYRYFLVTAEKPDMADFETTEEYDAATATAMADAVKKAESIAAGINSEEDYIAAALEYNSESYAEPDSTLRRYQGDLLGDDYGNWLRDKTRKPGDITTVEITTGCYVVYFIDRSNNDYHMTSMRQILISPEAVNEADFTDPAEYADALDEANKAAKQRADEMLNLFVEGGATEEKLLELMPTYTSDSTEGGLYENIPRYQMVPEVNDWLFDPARKQGDSELVYTSAYGWHLLYFMGFGERYCDYLAANSLRDADYNAWKESLGSADITRHWAFTLKTQ